MGNDFILLADVFPVKQIIVNDVRPVFLPGVDVEALLFAVPVGASVNADADLAGKHLGSPVEYLHPCLPLPFPSPVQVIPGNQPLVQRRVECIAVQPLVKGIPLDIDAACRIKQVARIHSQGDHLVVPVELCLVLVTDKVNRGRYGTASALSVHRCSPDHFGLVHPHQGSHGISPLVRGNNVRPGAQDVLFICPVGHFQRPGIQRIRLIRDTPVPGVIYRKSFLRKDHQFKGVVIEPGSPGKLRGRNFRLRLLSQGRPARRNRCGAKNQQEQDAGPRSRLHGICLQPEDCRQEHRGEDQVHHGNSLLYLPDITAGHMTLRGSMLPGMLLFRIPYFPLPGQQKTARFCGRSPVRRTSRPEHLPARLRLFPARRAQQAWFSVALIERTKRP